MKSRDWARARLARGKRPATALAAIGAAGSLLFAAAPAGAAAQAARPNPNAKVAVPQGTGPAALANATVFGAAKGSTPERVSFILKARHLGSLEARVETGMRGGYLPVAGFADGYGQSPGNVQALESYLAKYKIKTSALADRLDVAATGTVAEFNKALGVHQNLYHVPASRAVNGAPGHPGMTIHGTRGPALLPARLARFVLAILGLTNYPTFGSLAVHRPALARGVTPAATQTGSLTPADFAKRYNLDPLYQQGADGAGQTIGIVTLASLNPADPEHFWHSVLKISTKANRISLVNVDGGAGPVSYAAGSSETALDVEQSGALAPQADIVVYQAPNTDYGFVDGFFDAASQNRADSVSASWGESETAIEAAVKTGTESPAYAVSFDEAFLELAAQGQSAFVSAGDYGAYTAAEDIGTTNLAAGNPDSSPWVTSAGGTTLAGTIPLTATVSAHITAERTWGWDWLWPYYHLFTNPSTGKPYTSEAPFAESEPIGGGGGFSIYEPTPAYQQLVPSAHHFSAVQYLKPIDYQQVDGLTLPTKWAFTAHPAVTTGSGSGRATPDVSADADPFTGYLLYFSKFPSGGALQSGWGGTSFVAPQLNGATAVIDSYLHHRVGLWNPAIYRFALGPGSPFTPLATASASNDNLYYTGTPGQRFNVGSGLGTPNLARLAADFRG